MMLLMLTRKKEETFKLGGKLRLSTRLGQDCVGEYDT